MKPSPQFIVYITGIALLGFLYEPIRVWLGGGWLFLAFGVSYLLGLRLLGTLVGRRPATRRRGDGD